MDFSESMKVVFQRIQKLDPENVRKIIGHLLLQDYGKQEMIRLAFSPDNMIQSLIDKAKRELGLMPLPLMRSPFISNLPTTFTPFTPGGASGSSSSPLSIKGHISDPQMNHNCAPVFYFDPAMNQPRFSPAHLESCNTGGFSYFYSNGMDAAQCCPNLPNLTVPICEFFSQGYCKYGANCKFLHVLRMENGYMMVLNPPNGAQVVNGEHASIHGCVIKQLEKELIELLKTRNGVPVPLASLPALYCEKYGKRLETFEYHNHSQYTNFCCGLSKIISQMEDTIHVIDTPHGQPCLILTEDIPRYIKFIEERDEQEVTMGGLCQVYLTFPPQSMFSEQDVCNYFSHFGPVQDVRIPSQDKRMYGFVTFVFPETVTLVLTQANPHFICGAQVLVKPYRTKPVLIDRSRRSEENIQNPVQNNSSLSDAEKSPLSTPTTTRSGNAKFQEKEPIHAQRLDHENNSVSEIEPSWTLFPRTIPCSFLQGSTSEGQVGHTKTSGSSHNERVEEVNLPDSPFGCELVYGNTPSPP